MTDQYDLVVIGAGSGGMAAAKRAATRGASVALIEERTVGGTCVARGCMPKKFLYYAARRMGEIKAPGPAGLQADAPEVSWSDIIDHEQSIVEDLIGANRDGIEAYDRIDVIEGHATLRGADTVEVNENRLSAQNIILATGSSPEKPPIEGTEYGLTSDEFLRDHTLPYSMAFVGGGYIAVEFASILKAFDVDVAIFQRPDHIIPDYDPDLSDHLQERFEERGIEVHTGAEVNEIRKSGRSYSLHFSEEEMMAYTADRVVLATGRRPNTEGLGLTNAGLETDPSGAIPVNDTMNTEVDTIYAVGDLNRRLPFTPVAIREGKIAAENAVSEGGATVDYEAVPSAVFTKPQVASAGLKEDEARDRHETVLTAQKTFKPFSAAVKREPGEVFIKLVYRGEQRQLVGLHVVGPNASEIIQGFGVAIRTGVTQEELKNYPGIHPTLAEEVFSTKPT